jgi:hypothetical protein
MMNTRFQLNLNPEGVDYGDVVEQIRKNRLVRILCDTQRSKTDGRVNLMCCDYWIFYISLEGLTYRSYQTENRTEVPPQPVLELHTSEVDWPILQAAFFCSFSVCHERWPQYKSKYLVLDLVRDNRQGVG